MSDIQPVVLTGFMGAGKSTAAIRIASALDRTVVDVDALLERKHGAPCAAQLAEWGEQTFRQRERVVVEACLFGPEAKRGCVVALGGGALCNSEFAVPDSGAFIRRVIEETTVVLLDLDPDDPRTERVLSERLGAEERAKRPLLGASPIAKLKSRLADYRHAFIRIDATQPEPQVAAAALDRIEAAERLRQASSDTDPCAPLAVRSPNGTYPVWIREGAVENLASCLIAAGQHRGTVLVVTSPPLDEHAAKAIASLEQAGFVTSRVDVPPGEEYKTAETLGTLWDAAAAARLGRDDVIVAIGGGVVGDMAGFCAATFMRGTNFVQIPTTLLSMVDASVGGKVAIDRPQGKNLAGAFWSPLAVVVDPCVLHTLPAAEMRAGKSEVLKHAYLAGDLVLRDLLIEFTESEVAVPSPRLLRRAIAVKRDVVERDPFERGPRATLNLGHTFAHALEHVRGFSMRHGDAVAVGLLAAAHLGFAAGITPIDVVKMIESDLQTLGLDDCVAPTEDAEALATAMLSDKKRLEGEIRLVVLRGIGDAIVIDDPGHQARVEAWRAVGASVKE